MENHLFDIVRFVCYMLAVCIPIVFMIKADDRSVIRWLTGAGGAVAVYYNIEISKMVYQMIGALLETITAALGISFLIILMAAIAVLPLVAVVRLLFHR